MKVKIMTDVNAGLDYLNNPYDVTILRSSVNFKDEVLVDGIDITSVEFYERLNNVQTKEDIPSTSAPSLGSIYDTFDKFVEEGYTDVIHFPISFELSSTGKSVLQVAEEYKDKLNVVVINTKGATYLQAYLVLNACKMLEENKTVEDIVAASNKLIENWCLYFVVGDLNFLIKNGRLSNAAGFIGNLLKIKPLIKLTGEGKLEQFEKVKTMKKAQAQVIEYVKEHLANKSNYKLAIVHTCKQEDICEFKLMIETEFPNVDIIEEALLAPAVGAHVGPNVYGLCALVLE